MVRVHRFYRDAIETTPLVPPYADTESYRLVGPPHLELLVKVPDWIAELYCAWIRFRYPLKRSQT